MRVDVEMDDAGMDGSLSDAGVADSGHVDAQLDDASVGDMGTPDTGLPPCTLAGTLTIAGDYQDPAGNAHWLRQTASAMTHTTVPAGPPDVLHPPELLEVVRACADIKRLILRTATGTVSILDFMSEGADLRVCTRDVLDEDLARSAPLTNFEEVATGCEGAPALLWSPTAPGGP